MYKLFLYLFVIPLCIFAIDSIDITRFFKKEKYYQAKVFYVLLIFIMSYFVVNFIFDFIGVMN